MMNVKRDQATRSLNKHHNDHWTIIRKCIDRGATVRKKSFRLDFFLVLFVSVPLCCILGKIGDSDNDNGIETVCYLQANSLFEEFVGFWTKHNWTVFI